MGVSIFFTSLLLKEHTKTGEIFLKAFYIRHALNNRVIAHIRVISYSLYLWQQLFLGLSPFP
jgi:hypothetical protein